MHPRRNIDFNRLSQKDTAALHDTDPRQIRRWLKLGMPRNDDGTYSGAETWRWRAKHTNHLGAVAIRR